MREFGKKQIVVIALVVMIGIAGYINWNIKRNEETVPTASTDLDIMEYTIPENGVVTETPDGTVVGATNTAEGNTYTEAFVTIEGDDAMIGDAASTQVFETANIAADNSYFALARVEKAKVRSEAVDIYKELIDNANSSEDAKLGAERDMSLVAKNMELETIIENMIKAKGFEEAICYLSDEDAKVVVRTKGLVPAQVAQIKDIILDNTDILSEKIKIVEIY